MLEKNSTPCDFRSTPVPSITVVCLTKIAIGCLPAVLVASMSLQHGCERIILEDVCKLFSPVSLFYQP